MDKDHCFHMQAHEDIQSCHRQTQTTIDKCLEPCSEIFTWYNKPFVVSNILKHFQPQVYANNSLSNPG
jgi:hypothetical protein